MSAFGVAIGIAIASFLVWAFTGSYLAATLRDYWPELYAQCGAPKPSAFWTRRFGPGAFDDFTLFRRFRKVPLENGDIRLQLELICWSRWIQIAAFVCAICSLFLSLGTTYAP